MTPQRDPFQGWEGGIKNPEQDQTQKILSQNGSQEQACHWHKRTKKKDQDNCEQELKIDPLIPTKPTVNK